MSKPVSILIRKINSPSGFAVHCPVSSSYQQQLPLFIELIVVVSQMKCFPVSGLPCPSAMPLEVARLTAT